MMKMNNPICYVALFGLMTLLSACGGDDGKPGNPGEPGGPPAMVIDDLHITFDQVDMEGGVATVNYRVTNQNDEPVVGVPTATFIAAQLLPQGYTNAGNSSQWQYFTSENCNASCPGSYVDHKNGNYSYTFSAAFDGMNDISYQAGATQRIVVKMGGDTLADGTSLPITNQHFDWQAETDGTSSDPAYSRNLIKIDTCNSCHNDLAFHRGNYNQIETCVTCHNADRVSNPDNIFTQMIHGKHLTGFPGSLANCQTCHAQDESLSEQMNWARVPTMEACGSCHTYIDFKAGEGHPAQLNNANCVACHNADWTASVHNDGGNEQALAQFKPVITKAMRSGDTVSFTLALENPSSGERYTSSADQLDFISDLRVYANWGTSFDYATRSARSIRLHEITPLAGSNGAFDYQVTGLSVPAGSEMDKGTLAIQGRICAADGVLGSCDNEANSQIVIKSSHSFFSSEALSDSGRRVVVTNDTCGSCHGDQQLNFHGSRNDLEGQCQLCHNPNMVAEASENPSTTTADFKHLIHAIHSGQRAGYEAINYPGDIGNCAQCHSNNDGVLSPALPLDPGVKPLAISDGSYTSPTAAICSDCHSSETNKNHMIQQGAVFMGTLSDATAGTESCATCHRLGAEADVLKVHPIK
ncbi:OmcA/MtrC family decaheme c-type cytochrome [Shewanella marisflavi]|uniref:OmcA/MtrC family decaheme c-type cytochrome n=1 Tax=Shewanella marisflavi TaxID=260364 RepID=UPI00200EE372|nr:OmcA/MtrC family decaheme c-type cytochrome [Shewanella marisflavi]MCL1042147.1 OmcA/MtrC family decaheme c-type cytochrome [Shewanella marisflavi]